MRCLAIKAATAALAALLSVTSCREEVTQIVLVVDTNLAVPIDLDKVEIFAWDPGSSSGNDMVPAATVILTDAGSPRFPLTLGLTAAKAASAVAVLVTASLQDREVVRQQIVTSFTDGASRLLHVELLGSCIGSACVGDQTCRREGCSPVAIAGSALPPWTGRLPTRPQVDPPPSIGGRTVWANGWHSCANEGKTLYCWGQNSDGEIGNDSTRNANSRRAVLNVSDPAVVGLGQLITCICDRAGSAWCWGRNVEGQLGLGTTSAGVTVPTQIPGVDDCIQITGGKAHTCMVRRGGTVSCWGGNDAGQVGQPASAKPIPSPMAVAGLSDVADVQTGERLTCVRRNDMTVYCWGENGAGQLGDGTNAARSTPAPVLGLQADVVEIAAGRFFMCARHTNGAVSCWGSNGEGQLGDGTTVDKSGPVDVQGVTDAIQLAAGHKHTCALRRSGVVSCWGGNATGQLGDGNGGPAVRSPMPVDVLDLVPATSIAAGSVHTCARHVGGISCWGENIVNQIGDGTTDNRYRPVSVAGFQ